LPVRVSDGGTVGSYDYVTIEIAEAADDPVEAVADWLTSNGYEPSSRDAEALGPYLDRGFHLLAFKLTSRASPGAIRPVAITYESERPIIPMRATAVAAQRDMSVKVWVIGPSRAVPTSYRALVIDETRIDWLSAETYATGTLPFGGAGPFGGTVRRPSNYDAVVAASADEAGGRGFVTEMAAPASQVRRAIWSPADEEAFTLLSSQSYEDGLDALLAAREHYAGWDGWHEAVTAATTLPDGVTIEALERNPEQHRGVVLVDVATLLERIAADVVAPVTDAAALLFEGPYLTRFYTRIDPDEMTVDPSFDYDAELPLSSNVHVARQILECGPERSRDEAPWRIELPEGDLIVGEGNDWPVSPEGGASNGSDGGCSVSHAGLRTSPARASWWAVAATLLRPRRRRTTGSNAGGARQP
jgi:hypothetical protein